MRVVCERRIITRFRASFGITFPRARPILQQPETDPLIVTARLAPSTLPGVERQATLTIAVGRVRDAAGDSDRRNIGYVTISLPTPLPMAGKQPTRTRARVELQRSLAARGIEPLSASVIATGAWFPGCATPLFSEVVCFPADRSVWASCAAPVARSWSFAYRPDYYIVISANAAPVAASIAVTARQPTPEIKLPVMAIATCAPFSVVCRPADGKLIPPTNISASAIPSVIQARQPTSEIKLPVMAMAPCAPFSVLCRPADGKLIPPTNVSTSYAQFSVVCRQPDVIHIPPVIARAPSLFTHGSLTPSSGPLYSISQSAITVYAHALAATPLPRVVITPTFFAYASQTFVLARAILPGYEIPIHKDVEPTFLRSSAFAIKASALRMALGQELYLFPLMSFTQLPMPRVVVESNIYRDVYPPVAGLQTRAVQPKTYVFSETAGLVYPIEVFHAEP